MKSQFFQRVREIGMALAISLALGVRGALACGDFRMPSNHFEGVTSRGYVSIWKQLDALDLGDTSVPILLGAQTYRSIPSGALGSGWIMPLFDSGIVQRDENTFDMITPDGTMDFFYRDGSDPSILNGSSGWTGEIQGNDVIVHSKCGSGWKMVFRQGRLDTLSKGNHELRIQRDPLNRPTGITENGVSRVALNRDEKTGLMSALEMNGKKYQFDYDGKPQVENLNGTIVVGSVEPSLHKITYFNETVKEGVKSESYDFAVTEKMLPSLKITDAQGKERMIVWGMDGRILQDGEWNYKITSSKETVANAIIERVNNQKKKEYWYKDDPNGKETTVSLDGTKTERSWFTSGVLAGKERKEITIQNNKIINQNSWSYNEHGTLVRSYREGIATDYDEMGRQTKISQSGRSLNYTYDAEGFITSITKTP
jgi:YD repeat-containing protein